MFKRMIALAALTAAGLAQAQTYQAEQFRIDSCNIVAMRAKNAWSYREGHEQYPMKSLGDTPMSVIHEWAINYAMTEAASRDEAERVSFAKCMDNIDRVYRDARMGGKTSKADLQ